jgi:hypothetical protein
MYVKIFQMDLKYIKIFPTKICSNLDFWFEKKPSGNPGWKLLPAALSKRCCLSQTEIDVTKLRLGRESFQTNFHVHNYNRYNFKQK